MIGEPAGGEPAMSRDQEFRDPARLDRRSALWLSVIVCVGAARLRARAPGSSRTAILILVAITVGLMSAPLILAAARSIGSSAGPLRELFFVAWSIADIVLIGVLRRARRRLREPVHAPAGPAVPVRRPLLSAPVDRRCGTLPTGGPLHARLGGRRRPPLRRHSGLFAAGLRRPCSAAGRHATRRGGAGARGVRRRAGAQRGVELAPGPRSSARSRASASSRWRGPTPRSSPARRAASWPTSSTSTYGGVFKLLPDGEELLLVCRRRPAGGADRSGDASRRTPLPVRLRAGHG